MNDKTYTISELAELIGIDVKIVSNAKYSKDNPRPGSNIHRVIEKMDEMGITWDMVVSAPKGRSKVGRNTSAVDVAHAAPAPSLTPENIGLPLVERVPESPTPGMRGESNPDADDCCANDGCDQSDHGSDSVGTLLHLEDAIAAMRRHLPGAAITISIE